MKQSINGHEREDAEFVQDNGDSECDYGSCHHYGCMEERDVDVAAIEEFRAHMDPCLVQPCYHRFCKISWPRWEAAIPSNAGETR